MNVGYHCSKFYNDDEYNKEDNYNDFTGLLFITLFEGLGIVSMECKIQNRYSFFPLPLSTINFQSQEAG